MRYWKTLNVRIRIWICAVAATVSVLLIGAGKMNDTMTSYSKIREQARMQCSSAALAMSPAVPEVHRKSWEKMARENPGLCFRTTHLNLRKTAE